MTAHQILMGSGPVHCFDVETGTFPNEHDLLLYDLAELAGPPLAAAVFEEQPPPESDVGSRWWVDGREVTKPPEPGRVVEPYRLQAYLGGRSYRVEAQDFGDWYDLDQVLGLLNAMAVDQGADVRLTTLPTGGQMACVLAAPRAAILAGMEEGLLQPAEAGEAMGLGKAAEERFVEKLLSGEIEIE